MGTPVEPLWSIRMVGKGAENKQRELKSVVWVKWVKEMKGGHGEGNTAACAEAIGLAVSAQGSTLWACEFLSSAQSSDWQTDRTHETVRALMGQVS